jgi:hypothetical protein
MKQPRTISMGGKRWGRFGLGAALVLLLPACAAGTSQARLPAVPLQPAIQPAAAAAAAGQSQASGNVSSQAFTAKLQLNPSHAQIGETVQLQGSGYPANTDVTLMWYSAEGKYQVEGPDFVGQRYTESSRSLMATHSTSDGQISAVLEVPQDFGGAHDVRARVEDREISQASLWVLPAFTITPTEGPVGSMIVLRMTGVDSNINSNTWHLLYDNRYTGFVSAVTTHGVAEARFRAAGPIGEHAVSIWHNSFNSTPYLNWQQGPYKDTPVASFTYRVTSDPGKVAPLVEDFTATDNPMVAPATAGSAQLSLSADRGPVGTPTTLRGAGLPANSDLSLRWMTMVGNRVSATGFSEDTRDMSRVTTGPDGTFSKALTIPDDLGGTHRIDVLAGDAVLASTGMVIEPSVLDLSPTTVHAGEIVNVHLKGVGWTTYDNTYAATYDNSYIGYVCGFSTNGDVQFTITATGAPGTHLIDLYPTIYKGKDAMPRVYSIPQLTYTADHPARTTPAIRMSIRIAE